MTSSRSLPPCRLPGLAALAALVAAVLLVPAPPAAAVEGEWMTDLETAKEAAAEGDKLIFVDLYAEWCGWCKVLDEEVFSTSEFLAFTRDDVLLRLDVEDGGEGGDTRQRYGTKALPEMLILDGHGALVGRVQGSADKPEYLERLAHEIEVHERLLGTYEEALESRDTKRLAALAQTFHSRFDGQRAGVLWKRLESLGYEDARGPGWLAFLQADARRLAGDFAGVEAKAGEAHRLAEAHGDVELDEAVDLLRIRAADDRGACSDQLAALESFLETHPDSPYRRNVEYDLENLRREHGASGCS